MTEKYKIDFALIFGFLMIFLCGMFVGYQFAWKDIPTIQDTCLYCNDIYGSEDSTYSVNSLNYYIERINENCGSVFITKYDNKWMVFTKKPNKITGVEDIIYIPVNECLRG